MMELTRQRLIIIIVAGVAVIIFGLYMFLYGPLVGKLKSTSLEYKTKEAELLQAQGTTAVLKTIDIKKNLIAEQGISSAIEELTKQGKLKNVNFISITPCQIEDAKGFHCKVCSIEMDIESSYEQLGSFMGSLAGLQKSTVTVKSLNVKPDEKNQAKLKASLVVNIYINE